MRTRHLAIALLAGALMSIPTMRAQALVAGQPAADLADLSLEELMNFRIDRVFSASKYEQRVTRAPASVSIVTAAEIRDYGHQTLSDVLRSVRGLYVSNDGNYDYLGVRGFLRPGDYNTRLLMLVDGHRVNDAIYSTAPLGHTNPVEMDMIERVEVIRGPSSSIYGSSAFFGVVNIVTRKAGDFHGAETSLEAGSFGSYKGRLSYGREFENGTDLVLSASYHTSDGRGSIYYPEFDERISANPLARNNGLAINADSETAVKFSGSVKRGEFTLSGMFESRRKFVPTASFYTAFNDGRENTVDETAYIDLAHDHAFTPDLLLVTHLFYDRYVYRGDYPYDYAEPGNPPDVILNKDSALGDSVGAEIQLTAKLMGRHTIVTGGEFRYFLHQEQINYDDTTPRDYILNDDRTGRTMGLYAQGEFVLRPGLLLNAGLRYDYYPDDFGGTLNPRLGLIYSPSENTTIKALYGQAYRAPNAYERDYYGELQNDLNPERIQTAELVIEHYFASSYRIGLSAYRYQVRDLITQFATVDGDPYFANSDRTTAEGVEFELQGKFTSGVQARASFALQRTKDDITGGELTSSPGQLAKFNLILPLAKEHLTAGLELQYQGSVRTLAGATASDFLITNLTLTSRALIPGLELSASAYNLFDTRYGYPGAADHVQDVLPQQGRSLRLKATYRF